VVVDVQRVGPSTGMPTRTQQGDLLSCAYASHGDTKHILLFPANPAECFEFAVKSFDLAERFQTPVIMMSDLDIGMNDWVVPRSVGRFIPAGSRARAERRRSEKDAEVFPLLRRRRTIRRGAHAAGRGCQRARYVTRGSGHNKFGGYTETPANIRR
jgi:2-oxoglutarate ferredoxin oxidoreductase subunit alpha